MRSLPEVQSLFDRFDAIHTDRNGGDGLDLICQFQELVRVPGEEFVPLTDLEQPPRPHVLVAFAQTKSFPKTPWLELPAILKEQLVANHLYHPRVYAGLTPDDLRNLAKLRETEPEAYPSLLTVVHIPIGMTAEEVSAAFKTQIKELMVTQRENFRPLLGRRGGFGDKLQQLGAWRLHRHMSAEKVRSYTKKRLGSPLYQDAGSYAGAIKSAEACRKSYLPGNSP